MTNKQKVAIAFAINKVTEIADRIGTAEKNAAERYAAEYSDPNDRRAIVLGALSFHAEDAARELRALVDVLRKDFVSASQLAKEAA